ncbi:hypothetical protein B0H13DRAFT_2372400 [Mycena leptocephala]|nr:hypothetical protein B0H13DRAFT_2372400 [Mycena leptocephala]
MSYNPESTVARPLLALATFSSTAPGATNAARASSSSLAAEPSSSSAGLPIPDRLAPYYAHPMFPGGNAQPPAHGSAHDPHPGAPPGAKPPSIDGPDAVPPPNSHSSSSPEEAHLPALLSSQPLTLPAARARDTLKTARPLPKGFDALFAFAKERGCLVDGYAGREKEAGSGGRLEGMGERSWFRERRVFRFEYPPPSAFGLAFPVFSPFITHLRPILELTRSQLASAPDTHGIAALAIRDGRAHKPEHEATYFDGDWEGTVNKFASALPPMTILINERDEPRVVFDVSFHPPTLAQALTLSHPTPFALSPPCTGAFFAEPERRDVCRSARGVGWVGTFLVSWFLFSVLYGRWDDTGQELPSSYFARTQPLLFKVAVGHARRPVLISASAEFTTDLVPVLSMTKLADASVSGGAGGVYWRGKSNGGHIRGTNYRSFPRFRLVDLAAPPENRAKRLFDIFFWWNNLDLDLDERVQHHRGKWGLIFKSTAFAEFFTPWLVPYEHFIPVRPDLADLPAKIEWARANDGEPVCLALYLPPIGIIEAGQQDPSLAHESVHVVSNAHH